MNDETIIEERSSGLELPSRGGDSTQLAMPSRQQRIKRQVKLPEPRRIGDQLGGSQRNVQIWIRHVVLARSSKAKSACPWRIMDAIPSVIPESVAHTRMSPFSLGV